MVNTRMYIHYFWQGVQLLPMSVCWAAHPCSVPYHRRRCQLAAEAFGPHWEAGWGPPSSQNPGWFLPADKGWPGGLSSWGNSHRSERRRWPLEILYLCWLHLSYASGWTSYPWHLDNRMRVNTEMKNGGTVCVIIKLNKLTDDCFHKRCRGVICIKSILLQSV